jgi:hypothetical protein
MAVPPVVDHAKRAVLQEITSKSPFNIFNILALVAILVIGWFLWQKFSTKFTKGAIKIPSIVPMMPTEAVAKSAEVIDLQPEVIPEPGVATM